MSGTLNVREHCFFTNKTVRAGGGFVLLRSNSFRLWEFLGSTFSIFCADLMEMTPAFGSFEVDDNTSNHIHPRFAEYKDPHSNSSGGVKKQGPPQKGDRTPKYAEGH